ncbi:MAG: hypothetical protein IKN17_09915 [Ruminococcus sp.]|nr:hypothetical protein [Ruminococcus sp.]
MNKPVRTVHRILQALCLLCLAGSMVFYLTRWGSLPEQPGIHFAPDGSFDVYASKVYGFYPHLIMLITIVINIVVTWLVGKEKLKLGLKVDDRGKNIILSSIVIVLDIVALLVCGCFAVWSYSVSVQEPLSMKLMSMLLYAAFGAAIAGGIFQCVVNARHRLRPETEEDLSPGERKKQRLRFILTGRSSRTDPALFHGLSRAVSWLAAGIMLFMTAFVLERLPSGDVADEYHGLAYFANLDGYYAKWLVFLPLIAAVPFMALFEVMGIRAKKKGTVPAMLLADRLKLIFAGFGCWWELVLIHEREIGVVSVGLFLVLCAGAAVLYYRGRRDKE